MSNYNNSTLPFINARISYRERGIFLVVAEGHVIAAEGIVAKFFDDDSAIKCLTEAGYTRDSFATNIIFHPPTLQELKMEELLKKYGPDFPKKLRKYATAKKGNEYVAILGADEKSMMVTIRRVGPVETVHATELDNFVL